MKILFVDMYSNLAGHTRTATTIAQALQRRGHEVSFAVVAGSNTRIIEEAGFKMHPISVGWAGQYPALEELIYTLHGRGEVDVVHSFDKRGVPEITKAAKALGVPVFHTICGGRPPRTALEMKPIISLSHEVKAALVEKTGLREGDIEVIPARLDFTSMLERVSDDNGTSYGRFREKYNLPPSSKILLRIARVSRKYKGGLLQGADAAAQLHKEGYDVRFVHIGYVPPENREDFEEVRARFSDINRAAGTTLAVSVQDEAPRAPDYLGLADIVMGLGRTAFEGMLFEKPVVLLGELGYAGLVGRDDTEQLAFYNFAGRHLEKAKPYGQSVTELTNALRELLEDEALRAQVGEFGKRYVLENLDANAAAARYEVLYTSFSPDNYPSDEQIAAFLKLTPRRIARALLPETVRHYYQKLRYS